MRVRLGDLEDRFVVVLYSLRDESAPNFGILTLVWRLRAHALGLEQGCLLLVDLHHHLVVALPSGQEEVIRFDLLLERELVLD